MVKFKNVLSLFDGHSGGQIALNVQGIEYENYYASEIDKYAMQATKAIYPNTVQLGNIIKLRRYLEKPELYERMLNCSFVKQENKDLILVCLDLLVDGVDLLMAGFPCQAWSSSGKQKGLDDPRGRLALDLSKIFEILKPKHFLFENVASMTKKNKLFMDDLFKVSHIEINSALISAQNRNRIYWTNFEGVVQPEDRFLLMKDILEDYELLNGASIKGRYLNKATIIGRRLNKDGHREDYNKDIPITQCLEVRKDNSKSNCLTTVEKDNIITNIEIGRHPDIYNKSKKLFNVNPSGKGMNGWVYDPNYKSPTLTTNKGEGSKIFNEKSEKKFRTFSPRECGRLQTVPEKIIDIMLSCGISNSQLYKMFGNGFNIDTIAHILSYIK